MRRAKRKDFKEGKEKEECNMNREGEKNGKGKFTEMRGEQRRKPNRERRKVAETTTYQKFLLCHRLLFHSGRRLSGRAGLPGKGQVFSLVFFIRGYLSEKFASI